MKSFLLSLLQGLTVKTAVTAAVCVTATAAVTATATGVVYKNKTAQYEDRIEQLEAENQEIAGNGAATGSGGAAAGNAADATAVRVVDGILEVWDGSQWVDYGSVDEVAAADPYHEDNGDRREATEKSVAAKKLEELGLKVNEEGEIVPANPEEKTTKTAPILVGNAVSSKTETPNGITVVKSNGQSTANAGQNKAGNTASTAASAPAAGLTPEQVMAAIQSGKGVPAALAQTTVNDGTVTNVSWTASPSSGGGGDSYSGGGSSGGGSGSGGGSSYSAPSAPVVSSEPSAPSEPAPEPSGGDTGGGGNDDGGGGNDDGGGGGDDGGSDSGEGDGFSEAYY